MTRRPRLKSLRVQTLLSLSVPGKAGALVTVAASTTRTSVARLRMRRGAVVQLPTGLMHQVNRSRRVVGVMEGGLCKQKQTHLPRRTRVAGGPTIPRRLVLLSPGRLRGMWAEEMWRTTDVEMDDARLHLPALRSRMTLVLPANQTANVLPIPLVGPLPLLKPPRGAKTSTTRQQI